jgi:HEAT repeat protein
MTSYLRRHAIFFAVGGWIILAGSTSRAADSSVKELIDLLNSPDAAVRLNAIDQLGAQGEKAAEAAPALTSLLKDADQAVRRHAVKALVAIRPGPKVMIPLLIKLMEDSDPGVHARILNAITEVGETAVPGLIEALKNDKVAFWACIVLRGMGPAAKGAAPALAEKLKDPRPEIRREAVLALGAIGEAANAALPQIVAVLGDEDTRTAATFVLGQLGKIPADAEQQIRANAKSDDKFLSTVSYWALARVHSEDMALRRQATEQIVECLKDQDPYVRVAAARALAALPPAPEITIPILEKALKDADATTAHYALDALASIGAQAVPRLVDILEKHGGLRVEVAYILGQIGPAAAPATEALAKLVADKDINLATEAALALAKIGPAAKSAVPALLAALQKEGTNAHAIILALGNIGPDAAPAEPLLLKAMKSEDGSLAVTAASALTQIHPRSTEAAAKAIPVLVACLTDSLPETRRAAAESLGELGPLALEAVPALQEAVKDADKAVREAAAKALKSM